jgi:hypothetical protein
MGFMDKFKDMQDQAQQAAQAAQQSAAGMGGMGGAAAEAQKAQKIAQSGVKTPATLTSMTETGNKDPLSGGVEYAIEVEVKPEGGAPYTATFNQQLIQQSVDSYKDKVGQDITVNVDPDDPNSMLLWG